MRARTRCVSPNMYVHAYICAKRKVWIAVYSISQALKQINSERRRRKKYACSYTHRALRMFRVHVRRRRRNMKTQNLDIYIQNNYYHTRRKERIHGKKRCFWIVNREWRKQRTCFSLYLVDFKHKIQLSMPAETIYIVYISIWLY